MDPCPYKTFTRLPFGVSNSEQQAHSFAPLTYIQSIQRVTTILHTELGFR